MYNTTNGDVKLEYVLPKKCSENIENVIEVKDLACQPMYPYYCRNQDKNFPEAPKVKFDVWLNRNNFIISIYVLSTISFLIFWLVHKFKAGFKT